jgi:RNA polymerase sigma-70 factor (ECF subfamily)
MVLTERRSFDAFFAQHYPRVVGVLDLALRDRELARDAAQEAFSRAFERWSRVSVMSRPDGWVYVTAMNMARRERRRDQRMATPGIVGDAIVSDVADRVVTRLLIDDLLATLSPRQREAVVLRFAAGLTIDDVSRAMGCAAGTAKATLHQALQAMRVGVGGIDGH